MALADRYTFDFKTLKDGEDYNILIQQEGYAGSVETLAYMPGRDFITISYDKTNSNLLHPIRGSQLTLRISLTPTQIAEFILADNRTWYIIVTGTNGYEWQGWYQAQTSANYSPYGLREFEMQFSDNLGALQNTPDNVVDSAFVEKQSFATMIERLLSYTDIALPITYNTSITHTDFSTDAVQDIAYLEQSMTLDFNGQQPQPAYDVLSKILRMMQCVVYQKGGNWVIENLIDKADAGTPPDLLTGYQVLGRGLNVRFQSPLSKVTGRSYHYQIRHTQANRDFELYVPSGPNKGFTDWEQFGLLGNEMFSQTIISGKSWFQVRGNFTTSDPDSADYYENTGGPVAEGEAVRLYLTYEYTPGLGFQVDARIAVKLDAGGTPWYLRGDGVWVNTATPIIVTGDTDINNIRNIATIAPINGTITIRIYRPSIPTLPSTYNPTTTYMRFAYAEVLASKVSNPTDYKMFKSVGLKDNKGLRESEFFDTIGLQFDTEFAPNGASFFSYDDFVSFIYDNTGARLNSKFYSDYDATERSLTQFATNAYMRLFAKPQLFIEADLYGKDLNIGDVFLIDVPGFASALKFVCIAFDWSIKQDRYSALFAYIEYDNTDTITQRRYWLQQNQDDPDNK